MRPVIVNLCDMIDHCRARLDDLSPDSIEPATNLELLQEAAEDASEDGLLWSDAELTVYANEAVKEVALRTRCIRDSGRDKPNITTYAVAADTETVAVDSRILAIRRVMWDGTVLGLLSERFMDEDYLDWRTEKGTPECMIVRTAQRQIRLYKIPEASGTLTLDCDRLPVTLMEKGADVPEIPQHYLHECIDWMCHLAYLKNDADTYDPGRSSMHSALFAQKIGPRPTTLQLELEYHQSGRRRGRLYYY